MNAPLENDINNYITPFLLRYFQKATSLATAKQDIDIRRGLKLLRMHWSISRPLRELVDHVRKNPHEVAAILKSRVREDDARVLGRFDACASAIRRMKTGCPTLVVSHEPLRAYSSGPNRALVWVLSLNHRTPVAYANQAA